MFSIFKRIRSLSSVSLSGYPSLDLPKLNDLSLEAAQPFKWFEVLKVESGF